MSCERVLGAYAEALTDTLECSCVTLLSPSSTFPFPCVFAFFRVL